MAVAEAGVAEEAVAAGVVAAFPVRAGGGVPLPLVVLAAVPACVEVCVDRFTDQWPQADVIPFTVVRRSVQEWRASNLFAARPARIMWLEPAPDKDRGPT